MLRTVRYLVASLAVAGGVLLTSCSTDRPSDAVPVVTDVKATGRELAQRR